MQISAPGSAWNRWPLASHRGTAATRRPSAISNPAPGPRRRSNRCGFGRSGWKDASASLRRWPRPTSAACRGPAARSPLPGLSLSAPLPPPANRPLPGAPLMPPTAPLGFYWGDDAYSVARGPDALAARLAGDGPPLGRVRLSGSATTADEITEKVATATLFGGGTLVVIAEPAPLISTKPLA